MLASLADSAIFPTDERDRLHELSGYKYSNNQWLSSISHPCFICLRPFENK